MIKNIVFDIGNVLIDFKPLEYLNSNLQNIPLSERIYTEMFRSLEWIQLDQGTITEEDAIKSVCCQYPEDAEAITNVMENWYSLLTPIEGSVDILYKLRAASYKTYILSNYHIKSFEHIFSKYDFFSLFDGMVVSAKVKCLKPDAQIFHCLTGEYGIIPSESLFIDDTMENIDAAENLGFKAIHFTTPDRLYKSLQELNIL